MKIITTILIVAILLVPMLTASAGTDYWENPKVLSTCAHIVIQWDKFDVPFEDMEPIVAWMWFWDSNDELVSYGEMHRVPDVYPPTFTTNTPGGAKTFDGLVIGKAPEYWGGVVPLQAVRCHFVYVPIVTGFH